MAGGRAAEGVRLVDAVEELEKNSIPMTAITLIYFRMSYKLSIIPYSKISILLSHLLLRNGNRLSISIRAAAISKNI